MSAKVIQGFFFGGRPRLPAPMVRPPAMPRPAGPPAPAFAGRPAVAQTRGAGESFQVDAGKLGLASGGGRPLPEAVRGKMEAALGADFSGVRVHVGPQAERIGAIAFTLGTDIYFAPGRFQPDTVQGQQLLGHELAHVVQQRKGRVRNPSGSGVSVVQDRALEAEADRIGNHVATVLPSIGPIQAKRAAQRGRATPSTNSNYAMIVVGYRHRTPGLPPQADHHAFISVRGLAGRKQKFGFSPASAIEARKGLAQAKTGVPGSVRAEPDTLSRLGVIARVLPVSAQQALNALAPIRSDQTMPPRFRFAGRDCGACVSKVLRPVGLPDRAVGAGAQGSSETSVATTAGRPGSAVQAAGIRAARGCQGAPARHPGTVLQRQYNAITNVWSGGRPDRPSHVVTALGHANTANPTLPGSALPTYPALADPAKFTAHHKEDWNPIKDQIIAAIDYSADLPTRQKRLAALQKIEAATGATLTAAITGELGNPLPRTAVFQAAVKTFIKQACWTGWDLMIGPKAEYRDDDPTKTGRVKDAHFTASGHTTPKSELAQDIGIIGFADFDATDLTRRLNALADRAETPFLPAEWDYTGNRVTNAGNTLPKYKQKNDPYNWDGPQAEIVFPKENQVITSSDYGIRVHCNRKTNNLEMKVQLLGTNGNWAQARQDASGTWWFDWNNIAPGQYEIMARAWSADGRNWVSRHVRVSK